MERRSFVHNLVVALVAQAVVLAASITSSLLAPKVLDLTSFGYWQLFLLYVTYAGLFHLGLNDGVYLLNGGKRRESLDSKSVGSQFVVNFIIQGFLSAFFFVVSIGWEHSSERAFVIQMFAAYLIAYNLSAFLGYLFQAINETRTYSYSTIVARVVFLAIVGFMLIFDLNSFRLFVIAYVVGQYITLAYCLWKSRGIGLWSNVSLKFGVREALSSMRIGVSLMVANLSNLLIIGVARFVIDARWSIETFGQLSLMFSLISFVLLFISQVSMVLFPALRRLPASSIQAVFSHIRDMLGLLCPAAYLLYYPAHLFVSTWLPEYRNGLIYLCVLFPVAVFNGMMDVGYSTFFKVLRLERSLLAVNVCALLVSISAAVVGAFVFDSLWCVIGGVLLAVVTRFFIAERLLNKRMEHVSTRTSVSGLLLAIVFVSSIVLGGIGWGFVIFSSCYLTFLIVERRILVSNIKFLRGQSGK